MDAKRYAIYLLVLNLFISRVFLPLSNIVFEHMKMIYVFFYLLVFKSVLSHEIEHWKDNSISLRSHVLFSSMIAMCSYLSVTILILTIPCSFAFLFLRSFQLYITFFHVSVDSIYQFIHFQVQRDFQVNFKRK